MAANTAANTSNWTVVSNDGFGARKADLYGSTASANINLVSGFPDLKWCTTSSSGVCQFNTSTYSYPDATYTSAVSITTVFGRPAMPPSTVLGMNSIG